jgi:hypothetical protein
VDDCHSVEENAKIITISLALNLSILVVVGSNNRLRVFGYHDRYRRPPKRLFSVDIPHLFVELNSRTILITIKTSFLFPRQIMNVKGFVSRATFCIARVILDFCEDR